MLELITVGIFYFNAILLTDENYNDINIDKYHYYLVCFNRTNPESIYQKLITKNKIFGSCNIMDKNNYIVFYYFDNLSIYNYFNVTDVDRRILKKIIEENK